MRRYEITDVTLELLQVREVLDSRRIAGTELLRAAASGRAIQQSGMMRKFAFQFCGPCLIADGITLAGPILAPGQALLLSQQPFAVAIHESRVIGVQKRAEIQPGPCK